MYNVDIMTVELPINVRGLTVIENGKRNIFINSLYESETRNEILFEELLKIEDFSPEDFDKFRFKEGEEIN